MQETYVRITDDKTQAWLYLTPKEDDSSYTKEELIHILDANGVVAGLNVSNLAAMAKKKVYEREICVAKKVEPVQGVDGYYEYAFDKDYKRMPRIREDGSVDYTGFSIFQTVKKGSLLARYHKAVPGSAGQDVCGNLIPVGPVKELPPLNGNGIVRSTEDEDVYEADKDGKIDFEDGKMVISDVFTLTKDVDHNTGIIEFEGDLIIMGNVGAGAVIKTSRTLTINGTVEAANLTAGADIMLKRGIQGNNKARIEAKGTVYADFIEQTEVIATGNVEANSIVNSQINAEGKVVLNGKKGCLLGGYTHATKGIACKQLGNEAEVKTVVHSGCVRELSELYGKQRKAVLELKKEYEAIGAHGAELLALVKKNDGHMTEGMEKKIKEQMALLKDTKQKLEEAREQFADTQQRIQETRGAVIRIEGKFFVGTQISIDSAVLTLDKNNSYMEYRNISGMLAGNVIATG